MQICSSKKFDITVIIPTYNCRDYLPIAINSVLNQNIGYENIEILVIDDGSTDGTEILMNNYLHLYPNNIFYYKKENGNWGSVINYVKKNHLANGKMITILDSDDYFFKYAFEKILLHLDKDMIVSSFDCVNYDKRYVLNPYFGNAQFITNKKKLRTPHSQPISKFYSSELFYVLDDLLENVWFQDCIMYHNAISKTTGVWYIRESLAVWYSSRPGNSTTTLWTNENKFNAWCEILKQMSLHGAGIIVYIYSLLPGFIEALKSRGQKIKLPTKPSYTWLPIIIAPIFSWILYMKTRSWIVYPKKKKIKKCFSFKNKLCNIEPSNSIVMC